MMPAHLQVEAARSRQTSSVHTAIRVILGYLAAVATGYCVFLFLLHVWPGIPFEPLQTYYLVDHTPYPHLVRFLAGAVYGIPYTTLGVLAVKKLLPRNMVAFLLVGMFCPTSALALVLAISGMTTLLDDAAGIFLLTLPAGLAAAYVFGAIGMGYGFGRWSFG